MQDVQPPHPGSYTDEVGEAGSHFEAGRRTVDGQNLAPFQNAALATWTGLPLPHPLHV